MTLEDIAKYLREESQDRLGWSGPRDSSLTQSKWLKEAATLIEHQARRIEILTKGSKVQLEDRLIEQIEQQARAIEELKDNDLDRLHMIQSQARMLREGEQQLTTAKAELESLRKDREAQAHGQGGKG